MSNNIPPEYYQALFRFAQRTGADDPVNSRPSEFRQMSEEDRKFLENSLSELVQQTDPIVQLKKHMQVLMNTDFHAENESEITKGMESLEAITELCFDIDVSNGTFSLNFQVPLVSF